MPAVTVEYGNLRWCFIAATACGALAFVQRMPRRLRADTC